MDREILLEQPNSGQFITPITNIGFMARMVGYVFRQIRNIFLIGIPKMRWLKSTEKKYYRHFLKETILT